MSLKNPAESGDKQKPFMEYILKGILITLVLHTISTKKPTKFEHLVVIRNQHYFTYQRKDGAG
jgi:hypothetical protein